MSKFISSLLVLVVVVLPLEAFAQYPFGKNKVTYKSREWKVLETEHIDIYHYPADDGLMRYVAPLAEETYLEYSEIFGIEFDRRVPFVFYSTHYDFQQTNILPYLISEYTGGFTDLMKGRVAVPFTGSYANFRHVVRHELVHAFMLEKLRQVMKEAGKFVYAHPPLWFVEGMAEYFATSPQNRQGNMFVRDALVNDRLLPLDEIWRIQGSFMMYKEGEAVVNYIASNFGEKAVVQILDNWWTADKFTFVLQNTINMNLEELNDAFMRHIKRIYYPTILYQSFAEDIGERLTPPGSFHSRPAVISSSPDGNELDMVSLFAQDGVINVSRIRFDEEKGREEDVIVKGGRSSELESLPAFRSKLEVHGDTLMFVTKSKERDTIYLWSISKKEPYRSLRFPGLSLLQSPTLSGDHTQVAFSAIDSTGTMDLFLYNLNSRDLTRLTDDGFSEEDPDFHPRDNVILFTSDRGAGGERGRTHIYRMDLTTRKVTPVEGGDFGDSNPEWSPDGETFLFTSDREGTQNIYHHKGNVIVRQTNAIGGVSSPSWLPDGTGFVASVYERGEFSLYQFPIRNGVGRLLSLSPPDSTTTPWPEKDIAEHEYTTKEYSTRFGIDFIGVGVSVDPEFGEVGNGGALVMTDILGNHQIQAVFGTTTEDTDNIWQNVNAAVTYVNLSRRINYSLSLFNLNSINFERVLADQREKRVGGAVGLSYPLNKFERIDGTIVMRQIERINESVFLDVPDRRSFTGSVYGTYVRDHALWTIGGPLTGYRYYLTLGQTVDFNGKGFDNTAVLLDFRKYFKLSRRIVWASRYITRNAFGSDDQVYYLGGPWTLRGYGFREFFGRTIHLLNTEIRFPLIDRFALKLPFGLIEMPMFRGALFFDAGRATRNPVALFNTETIGSFGAGVELNLGYAPVIRVNFTRFTDFDTISSTTGFELFIGFNY